jgi:hypothetical protein
MIKPCGIFEPCSPRGPRYSGKLIARAVELYLKGVKPGYIRWDELQYTLEKEFPSEFPQVAQDKPSPETVLSWVRKRPDAPERLKSLRVQQAVLGPGVPWSPGTLSSYYLPVAMPVPYGNISQWSVNVLFSQFIPLMALAILASCTRSLIQSWY